MNIRQDRIDQFSKLRARARVAGIEISPANRRDIINSFILLKQDVSHERMLEVRKCPPRFTCVRLVSSLLRDAGRAGCRRPEKDVNANYGARKGDYGGPAYRYCRT